MKIKDNQCYKINCNTKIILRTGGILTMMLLKSNNVRVVFSSCIVKVVLLIYFLAWIITKRSIFKNLFKKNTRRSNKKETLKPS